MPFHPQEEVYEVTEGELEVTIDGVAQIAGPGLVAIVSAGRLVGVAVQLGPELTLGDSRPLFQPKSDTLGYDVSADGRRFLIATSAGTPVQSTVILNWSAELKGK